MNKFVLIYILLCNEVRSKEYYEVFYFYVYVFVEHYSNVVVAMFYLHCPNETRNKWSLILLNWNLFVRVTISLY